MDDIFDALGERKRREILAILAAGEQSAGDVVDAMQTGGSISQPAVSQHLKVLRESGLVTMRAEGTRRVYAINSAAIDRAQSWLANLRDPLEPFAQAFDALGTEVARGQRSRRTKQPQEPGVAAQGQKRDLA